MQAPALRELHVEGNVLSDTESRPVVRGVLSRIPSLRAYDISGNKFRIPSKAARATHPPAVHVVLHIDVDTRQLCPDVPVEACCQYQTRV